VILASLLQNLKHHWLAARRLLIVGAVVWVYVLKERSFHRRSKVVQNRVQKFVPEIQGIKYDR
jgi:hypothetical protein